MIKVYSNFDDMPSSDQFSFTELFPKREGDFDDVVYFFLGYRNWGEMYNFVINNGGNPETDLVAVMDETTTPSFPLWLYAIITVGEN